MSDVANTSEQVFGLQGGEDRSVDEVAGNGFSNRGSVVYRDMYFPLCRPVGKGFGAQPASYPD
jgi:hypothetical protein